MTLERGPSDCGFKPVGKTDLIVRKANRDWACQTERCQTLSNKTSLQ